MKIKKAAVICRRIIFIALIIGILIHMAPIFERKTLNDQWNYTLKVGGFANEPESSIDIVGVGSSHLYCTLNPVYMYSKTGLSSYVLATQQQPVEATYYYVKEALEQQSPDVVIIEAFMYLRSAGTATEGVAHDATDPFPDNLNKLNMIHEMAAEGEKENYYFNFMKYHTRWKQLNKTDFERKYESETDPFHGFVFLTNAKENTCTAVSYDNVTETPIDAKSLEYLEKTVKLIRDSGSKPMILIAPYANAQMEAEKSKYLHSYCEANGIAILDMNLEYDSLGIDNKTDFFDGGHLNVSGAEKASLRIASFITENFGVSRNDTAKDLWQADITYYYSKKPALITAE